MAESRFISAARLKPFIGYLAVSFVVLLLLAEMVPRGSARTAAVAAWFVLFPLGGWLVLRRE